MKKIRYMKPAASRNIDSEPNLSPPAAPCQRRTGHWWCFWTVCSTVA